jgi:hypothetical protein
MAMPEALLTPHKHAEMPLILLLPFSWVERNEKQLCVAVADFCVSMTRLLLQRQQQQTTSAQSR